MEAFVSDPWICLHNHWSDPDYDRIRRSKHSDLLSRWRLRLRSARIAHIGQPTPSGLAPAIAGIVGLWMVRMESEREDRESP